MALAAVTHGSDPSGEDRRERLAELLEDRLDLPMALLAAVWVALAAYDISGATAWRDEANVATWAIWGIFVAEFVVKLAVSGRPLHFLRRRWPALLFLTLPALRVLRLIRSLRLLRALPAARVAGSSYRAIGSARGALGDRIATLVIISLVVVVAGAQFALVVEPTRFGTLGEALWWSANVGVTGNLVDEPDTVAGRMIGLALSVYAVVVVGAVAGAVGAYFIDERRELDHRTDDGVSTPGGGGT